MIIGVPKEIKNQEYRVGMTPGSVRECIAHGHKVVVQSTAGIGIGCSDDAYQAVGASISPSAEELFNQAEMIVKVKEPQKSECKMLREGQILFTYLHLAPDEEQVDMLLDSGCTAIAYETITDSLGNLPLLAPMSAIAGRMAIHVAAYSLHKNSGGSGILLGGVPGTQPAKVLVVGGGVVGTNAAQMGIGLGSDVTVIDKNMSRLRYLDEIFGSRLKTCYATLESIEEFAVEADVVVGAVLIPGSTSPKLINRTTISKMKPGSVIVDVAIDQGGCFETSKATTHDFPTYLYENVVHYCVSNMPGAVAKTSAFALNNVTLPFVLNLADKGLKEASYDNSHLRQGLNIHAGKLTSLAVAKAQNKQFIPVLEAI